MQKSYEKNSTKQHLKIYEFEKDDKLWNAI